LLFTTLTSFVMMSFTVTLLAIYFFTYNAIREAVVVYQFYD
jgi:hypothetical protein